MDSTADDVNEATPALTSTMKEAKTAEVVVRDDAISSTTADKYIENLDTSTHNLGTDSDAEADFLEAELSISNIASEKITENVEDIVQDLENLLGGSSEYFGRDTSVQPQTCQSENNNGKELVSSQEVTSANVPLSDIVEQLEQVECINEVETTPINKLNEKESVEIHIVDSTVNSKTYGWCNVDESSGTNTFLFEVGFKPDKPHVECKSEDSVNTAVSQTIPDLPVFEETLNCDWNSVEKSNEANQNVYKTDRTIDGILNQRTVDENEKLQFGDESTEVTTSQCATEESITPVEVPRDTNQVETILVIEGTEQLNLTKVVDGTINQEQHTELSDDKSLEAPTNTNMIPTTECVNQADILDAKIFSVDVDLVEDEKPTTSTVVNIPQVSSEAEAESLAVNEVANPAEIDDAQIPQFTSEELPHSEDVNLTVPQDGDHVQPLCSQEEMLEDINQMNVADTEKEDLLVNEENKNAKVAEDEVVVNTDVDQNVNEEKVICFSEALEDLNTLEDEDMEKVSLKNQIDTKSTQHEDNKMFQTISPVEAANVGEEILENSKEIEENGSLVNEEELPKNSNEIEPLCLGEEMFDKTVDQVNQGADDTLAEVLQNSHEDLHLVENAKDVEEITFVNKEVGVESTESSNSEVFDNLHLDNDKSEIVNEEEVEKGEALCVNIETLESADQILNVEVTEDMNQTKSDELDESDVTESNSNLDQEIYVSQEISESQKQTEVMDLEMTQFINEVVDVEVRQPSAFIHTEAESLCVTDGMLRSVDEMADEAVTFANSDNAEFSPNVLESEGQANDDIPTDSSVSDYINQEDDLTLAIHESEIQEAPLQLEATQYTNEDASELDLACKSIEIQMVSEKMDGELLQQDGCGTQFLELAPDESMSEQSIAIASIMNEMDGAEGEVPILSLDETVSFPELSEPLPELITEKIVNLPQEKDDLGEGLNPDSMTAEPNNAPMIELVQPLTVDVEEGVVNTDNTTEVEEPSQSDGESLKMSTTDSVHSILKIYHPEDSTVEAVQSIPEPSDALTKDDVPSTTTDYLEREIVDNLVVQGEGVDESNVTVITKADPMPCVSTRFISDSDIADGGVSSTYDTLIKEKLLETRKQEDSTDQKKVDLETRPNLTEDFQSTSNFISNIVMEKLEKMHSPKITIKPIVKPSDGLGMCSPKPAILKPEDAERESLKITLKSLLKSSSESHYVPERYNTKSTRRQGAKSTEYVPSEHEKPTKITIKPMLKFDESDYHSEDRHSPKITIKPIRKPVAIEELQQSSRITIKPIPHPIEDIEEQRPSPKITIKPIVKPSDESEDSYSKFKSKFPPELEIEERHSPKITIKPIPKPTEEYNSKLIIKPIAKYSEFENVAEERHSPKIIIKPIKPPDDIQISVEDQHGAKITIKPIPKDEIEDRSSQRLARKPMTKREEYSETSSPRITIKPIIKPQEIYERSDEGPVHPFKLNIKPVVRPAESSSLSPKITIKPVPKPEPVQPFELIDFEDQIKQERIVLKIPKNRKTDSERVNKIKVKLSKDHGVAQILPTKRPSSETMELEAKLLKTETPSDLSISVISNTQTEVKKESSEIKKETTEDVIDPLSEIPVFEITLESASAMNPAPKPSLPLPISVPPTPRKRGRPRKVPLEVREEFKDTKEEGSVVIETIESSRPKRSCRGTSVRATLGIKPRKPRGGGGRGRGRPPGSRSTKKERKPYVRKNLIKDSMIPDFKDFDVKHGEFKHVPLPIESGNRDVVIYEEETRMSADNSSRAQTPAKQVFTSTSEVIEESQSSIQSNTTTESGEKLQKIRKGTRLEVHQEPEGEVISADKLAEYSWGGGGPYMLQEQVAQFLGIKSFKRKYPGIHRRPVDMQERDFIRESCLASEAMCDMGLTAVKREDILDIMYTDFQHKYEEYCKHQRDRQAKDVSNKQKALSLAASQEKNKLDIVEQAVQSAFQWNATFNKARKDQRRACLDLQTFTVHYPKAKMKQISKPPPGNYPLALVPGQYSDYYKRYNPVELSKLPLNTVGKKAISIYHDTEDSQSDGSGSDSDSSSSDTDSSYSGSSVEDCKMCESVPTSVKKLLVN